MKIFVLFLILPKLILSQTKDLKKSIEVNLGFTYFTLSSDWKQKKDSEFGNFPTYVNPSGVQLSYRSFSRDFKGLDSTVTQILESMKSKFLEKGENKQGFNYRLLFIEDKNFDPSGNPAYLFLFSSPQVCFWDSVSCENLISGLMFSANLETLKKEKKNFLQIIETVKILTNYQKWKQVKASKDSYKFEVPANWVKYFSFWSESNFLYIHEQGICLPSFLSSWKEKSILSFYDLDGILQSGELVEVLFVPKAYQIQKVEKIKNKKGVEISIYSGKARMEKENSLVGIYFFVFPLKTKGFGIITFLGYNGTKQDKERILDSITIF